MSNKYERVKQPAGQATNTGAMLLWKLRMPMTIAILVGIFLVTLMTRVHLSQSSIGGEDVALLYVADRTIDLGELSSGDTREVAFRIVNKGKRRLVINQVDRECDCGEPVRRTMVLSPVAAEDWVVNVNTTFAIGAFEKLTSFTTSDPTQPRFDLLVKGSVRPAGRSLDVVADRQREVSVLITGPE